MYILKDAFKILVLFIAVLITCFLDSCTLARVFTRRHITFVTAQDSTYIVVNPGELESWHKSTEYNSRLYETHKKLAVHKKVIDTLTNAIANYDIEQFKKGYLSSFTPIKRTRFNGVKILDFALPGLYLMCLVSVNVNSDDPSWYPLYYYPIFGIWANLLPGPWVTYKSTYRLPSLVPVQYRESGENRIYVKDVTVDSVNTFAAQDYSNFGNYAKHHQKHGGRYYARLENSGIDKYYIKDTLNRLLRTWGYVDTSGGMFSRFYNGAYKVKCVINSHAAVYVGDYKSLIVKCTWKIFTPEGNKELLQVTTLDTSKWSDDFTAGISSADGLTRAMNHFLQNGDVIQLLKQNYSEPVPVKDTVDIARKTDAAMPVTIKTKNDSVDSAFATGANDTVKNLQDALQAVVTIKQKDRFFSGCIISANGYIVTNEHLFADEDNSAVYVHFANGDSCTATFIKVNSVYDMVLYKIDKPGIHYKCFSLDTSHTIKLAEEVYAIGTAEDIRLTQTMTKGIVSGKRKIKDKMLIQTDASINAGSSGGALVNKNGHFMGILNSRMVGDNIQGIGFVVPAYYIDYALDLNPLHNK